MRLNQAIDARDPLVPQLPLDTSWSRRFCFLGLQMSWILFAMSESATIEMLEVVEAGTGHGIDIVEVMKTAHRMFANGLRPFDGWNCLMERKVLVDSWV